MTRSANARIAGAAFLLYLAAGLTAMRIGEAGAGKALNLVETMCALTLAVTLFAITREYDEDLARMAMLCRLSEGVSGALGGGFVLGGFLFSVGSTLFAWLLVKGRVVPSALGWLGVVGSALAVLLLPAQYAGWLDGLVMRLIWIPIGVFELVLGTWLLVKGAPARTPLPRTG